MDSRTEQVQEDDIVSDEEPQPQRDGYSSDGSSTASLEPHEGLCNSEDFSDDEPPLRVM